MLNLSDKELDRLSREAAEKFEVDQDPAAWNRLEQLLDKELGRSSPIPKFSRPGLPFIYTPAIIILIGATYFLLKPSKHTINSTQKNYSSESKKKMAMPSAGGAQYSGKTANSQSQSVSVPEGINKESTNTEMAKNGGKSIAIKKASPPSIDNHAVEKPARDLRLIPSADKKEKRDAAIKNQWGAKFNYQPMRTSARKSHQGLVNNTGVSAKGIKGDARTERSKKDRHGTGESSNLDNSYENNGSLSGKAKVGKYHEPTAFAATEMKTAKVRGILPVMPYTYFTVDDSILSNLKIQETGLVNLGKGKNGRHYYTNRSLQIGLLFSPDFSEVRYNYENKVGSNLGFSIGYQLSAKLAINSGLVFTNKNYTANGYDFHAPPGYWTNRVDLEFVKANCRMLEIPLNLRYDINRSGNTTFFINGGFSSYLLKKESYDFYYHPSNFGSLRQEDAEYSNAHNYWLSVLNLSTGFETKISNSFSFQVEPYMKLPLTGIGFGKVDLTSYGIDLSIKFSPVLKQSRR